MVLKNTLERFDQALAHFEDFEEQRANCLYEQTALYQFDQSNKWAAFPFDYLKAGNKGTANAVCINVMG